MGILGVSSPFLVSRSSTTIGLTLTAIAIAVILLASNFTIINAQQQSLTSQPGEIENRTTAAATTTFQSTNDSFSIQVPDGWVIQDLNNTGSALLEESTRGYGILAQLCPDEEEQQQQQQGAPLTNNASGGSTNSSSGGITSCQEAQEVIYIIRYPDLDTRIQAASNVTTTTTATSGNNNITTDNVQSYHLQKLQEVGYRSPQILNSTEVRLNLTNPQTNETIATVPARLVEMAYSTNAAPNETRTGYFISTATNATAPNLGTTKGYTIFYEGNSTTAAEITAASGSLPTLLPPAVGQVFDSFELIAAPEVAQTMAQDAAQAAQTAEGRDDGANDDDDDDDDDGANDDDDDDDDDGANDDDDDDDDDGANDDGGISSRGDRFAGDDYDGDDDDGANDDDGGDDDGDDYDGGDDDGGISSRGDRFAGDDYG
jgi:hypothetical protein